MKSPRIDRQAVPARSAVAKPAPHPPAAASRVPTAPAVAVLKSGPGAQLAGLLPAQLAHLQHTVGNRRVVGMIGAMRRPGGPGAETPARGQLREAATKAKRAIAQVPPATMPDARSPGAATLVRALQTAAETGRTQLTTAAHAAFGAAHAETERQAGEVQGAAAAATAQVQTHFQQAGQKLSATFQQQADAISEHQTAEQGALAEWRGQAGAQAQAAVQQRSDAVAAAGDAGAARITATGQQAADTARGNLASAADTVRSRGGGDGKAGHAEVAKKLGGDMAGQFEAASSGVGSTLQTHAGDAAAVVTAHARQAAAVVAGHAATLGSQIDATAEGAGAHIASSAHASIASLEAGWQEAEAGLHKAEAGVADAVQQHADRQSEAIHAAGREAVDGIGRQVGQAVGDAGRQIAEQAEQIAGLNVDAATAAELAPALTAQVAIAHTTAADEVQRVGTTVSGHLSTVGQRATTSLAQAQTNAVQRLGPAAQSIVAGAQRVATTSAGALSSTAAQVKGRADAGISKSLGQLDQAAQTVETGLGTASDAAERSVAQGASEAERLKNEATTGLHGRIAEGQQRVDGFVSDKATQAQSTSVQRSVMGWLSDQFNDLLGMLSSPAFWVGLVVTVVLFPVMGPAAMVVGGAAGGAVAGIQQNIKQGRAWYDAENIWKSAAVGALGGLLMAAGTVVIAFVGLEGAAATVAFMALSAVVGIVINVVTGERWDKGLLANLFLAWLFRRIAAKPVPEEAPPAAPGRTASRVPGLYEGIDPNTKPVGFTFKDTIATSGGETTVTTEVTASDGSTGSMERGFEPGTGKFILHYAFLDGIPRALRWVQTTPEMVNGRGTPLETYMTMRQMKLLEQNTGSKLAITAPRAVKISTVINKTTVSQLAKAVPGQSPPSAALDQAIMNTHSVEYAKNSIVQTGGRIVGAKVQNGYFESAADAKIPPDVMTEYGLKPTDQVLYFFDIVLDVVPADMPPDPGAPQAPAVPPPVPGGKKDEGADQ